MTELTIGAGVASGTIEIETKTDTVLEPDETLVLELTAASTAGEVNVATATATATIEDTGGVKVSVEDERADEGDGVAFEVRLSGEVSSEVKVSYATTDGTAVSGTDYTGVPATTLTFTAGQTAKTVTVATTEDDLNEANETFTVSLSGVDLPDGVTLNADKDEATGTIEDDDALTVSVAGPVAKVEEGQTATFTVTVNPGTKDSTTAVVVSYAVDTGASTASSGDDYTAPSVTELTIGAGVASGTIEIETKTDTVLEPDETLVLELTAASTAGEVNVATATATATIEDTGGVKVSVEDERADEGDGVAFEVRLSGEVSSEVKVSYATTDGTAVSGTDYTGVPATTLTFTAGQTAKTVTVATTEDDLNEANETFTVSLSGVDLPDGVTLNADKDEATGTIEDDDALTVSVAGPVAKVEEGQTATFTVTVNPGTKDSTTAVVVSYAVDTGASTASAGDDYTAPSVTELTIGAGVASGTIEIETKTDTVLEPDETLVLELTAASTAGEVNVATATATATIEDTGGVKVSVEDERADEGDGVAFEVRLSGEVSSEVKVSYATTDGTAVSGTDYTGVPATTLTFTAGQTAKTVTVATTEDDLNEANETFTVSLSGVDLPDGVTLNADKDEATGTIEDDDALTVSVAGPVAKVEEGQTATFTVTVNPGTKDSTTAVVVSYAVDTGASTASSGDDYTAPSVTELTIGAGVASGTIEIETKTDTVLEPDETLVLELTAASTAGEVNVATATATATIEDTGGVKVSVEDERADEGDGVAFEVRLSGEVSSEVKVSYATTDGTAVSGTDYTGVPATTLTFTAGQTAKTVTVATTEDDLNEANETFTVSLSGVDLPDGVTLNADKDEATGTIEDDDALTVSVAGPVAKVEEGQTATFTVTVNPGTKDSTTAVVVSYAVDTGASTASSGDDYTAPSVTELTIGAGVASGTIEIETKTDTVLEPDETLVLELTAASTAGEVNVATATATATIEDTGGVKVSVEDERADEGDGVAFEVRLSGEVSSEVKVSYATTDGTAVSGTDYTGVPATTLTFTAGQTAKTVTVATTEDDLNEANETFTVSLSGVDLPDGVTLNADKDEATGTIEDDDALTVSVAGPVAKVEEGQTATFTVTVNPGTKDSTTAVVVSYAVDTGASTASCRRRLHGAERDGADDRRWSGERDDRDRDKDGHGAGAGRDAGVGADRSEHGW